MLQVRELSEEHISHLVKMTRDFSMVFYEVLILLHDDTTVFDFDLCAV